MTVCAPGLPSDPDARFSLAAAGGGEIETVVAHGRHDIHQTKDGMKAVSYTHLTLPTNREV